MAFRSNIMLRQKLNIKPRPPVLRTYTAKKRRSQEKKSIVVLEAADDVSDPKPEPDLSMEADVEYLTVIMANDESTESGDETIECLIEDQNESEEQQNDDGIEPNEEIPKVSLANYRRRTRNDRNKPNDLTCQQCNKTLSNFSSYKYHMQLHSDETPYLCSGCGQGFKTKNSYDGHMMTHLETNPNKCTICHKVYRQAASLKSHMLTHTGEKVSTRKPNIFLVN